MVDDLLMRACDFVAEPTLLSQFYRSKLGSYIEPSRKGTPRGDKIGFPRNKYAASLLMITNLSQREIAERLGVSHKLVLKWHMEPDYRKVIERHSREFAEILTGHIFSGQPGLDKQLPMTDDAAWYGDIIYGEFLSSMILAEEGVTEQDLSKGDMKGITDTLRLIRLGFVLCHVGKARSGPKRILKVVVQKVSHHLSHLELKTTGGIEMVAMQGALSLVTEALPILTAEV